MDEQTVILAVRICVHSPGMSYEKAVNVAVAVLVDDFWPDPLAGRRVKADWLNIRRDPAVRGRASCVVKRDTMLDVWCDRGDGWSFVTWGEGGQTRGGWCATRYLGGAESQG